MTEDGAVFGGMNNLIDGLENSVALYKPEMIAVSTTCMAEVIGDDLQAFISNARQKGAISKEIPVPYANTPSFSGSHITGYDSMLKSILSTLFIRSGIEATPGSGEGTGEKLNVILGFEPYTGILRKFEKSLPRLIQATPSLVTTAAILIPRLQENIPIIMGERSWQMCRKQLMRWELYHFRNILSKNVGIHQRHMETTDRCDVDSTGH